MYNIYSYEKKIENEKKIKIEKEKEIQINKKKEKTFHRLLINYEERIKRFLYDVNI